MCMFGDNNIPYLHLFSPFSGHTWPGWFFFTNTMESVVYYCIHWPSKITTVSCCCHTFHYSLVVISANNKTAPPSPYYNGQTVVCPIVQGFWNMQITWCHRKICQWLMNSSFQGGPLLQFLQASLITSHLLGHDKCCRAVWKRQKKRGWTQRLSFSCVAVV